MKKTTSKSYSDKLKDPRWQRMRLEVMERDDFQCQDCGGRAKSLHVHHCFYERGDPWDTPESLLKTLCEDCHKDRQEVETAAKQALGVIFANVDNRNPKDPECVGYLSALRNFTLSMMRVANILEDSYDIDTPLVVDQWDLKDDALRAFYAERAMDSINPKRKGRP